MKTTLEIPNDLYRQAKAQAALENLKMKDLVAEGLRLALAQHAANRTKNTPRSVLEEIRQNPLHPPGEIEQTILEADRERKAGWSRSDLAQ